MSIPNPQPNRYIYTGDGASRNFTYGSLFANPTDLVVLLTTIATGAVTTLGYGPDYTVAGGDGAAGSITTVQTYSSAYTITIYNDPAIDQTTVWVKGGAAPADTFEDSFDYLTLICQRLRDMANRTVTLGDGYSGSFTPTLPVLAPGDMLAVNSGGTAWGGFPSSANRANKFLGFDGSGLPMAGTPVATALTASSFGQSLLAAANAAAARVLLISPKMKSIDQFGAVGDGVTDDTTAMQAALGYGERVFLIPGQTYLITSTITWNQDNCGFWSTGGATIKWGGVSGNSTMVKGSGTTHRKSIVFDNISFDTNAKDGMKAIDFSDCNEGCAVRNCQFTIHGNNTRGVYMNFNGHSTPGPYYCEFFQNNFFGDAFTNSTTGSWGYLLDRFWDATAGAWEGPNANRFRGGRAIQLDGMIWIRGGQDNYVEAFDAEGGIRVCGYQVGDPTPDESDNVSSSTINTLTVTGAGWATNQWTGGTARVIIQASNTPYYFSILSNTSDTLTFRESQQVLATSVTPDTVDIFYPGGVDNHFHACRQEGESGADMYLLQPGEDATKISGGHASSLGSGLIVHQYISKPTQRINPESWQDPFPIFFTYENPIASLTEVNVFSGGTLPFLVDGLWQVLAMTAQLNQVISAGSANVYVADNFGKIVASKMILNAANTSVLGGYYGTTVRFPAGSVQNAGPLGPPRVLSLVLTTDGSWAPVDSILMVTIWVQRI